MDIISLRAGEEKLYDEFRKKWCDDELMDIAKDAVRVV